MAWLFGIFEKTGILLIRRKTLFLLAIIVAGLVATAVYTYLQPRNLPPGPSPENRPLAGKKILIDVGHGGIDSGTNTKEGFLEKTVNLEMATILKPRLEQLGATVLLSRESDVDLSGLAPDHPQRYRTDLSNRVRWVNDNQADLLLSLHINSARDPQMRGAILLYHPKTPFTDRSKELAYTLQKELNGFYAHYAQRGESYLHQPYGGDFFVLEYVKVPSVIIEMGFITNYQDRSLFLKADFRNALAQKITDGVVQFVKQEPVKKTFLEWLWPGQGHQDGNSDERADMVTAPGPQRDDRQNSSSSTGTEKSVSSRKGKLAIIIDDLGNYAGGVEEILSINRPLTVAIMPFFKDSQQLATRACHLGFEVMVHMPMQSEHVPAAWYGPRYVTTRMDRQQIASLLDDARDVMPFAAGVNNHMGIVISRDEPSALITLEEVKKRQWYFVDSVTVPDSVFPRLAKEIGAPLIRRDVFLDHDSNDIEYIKGQLQKAGQIALKQGHAVAIGHVGGRGKTTARAIREMIGPLEKLGVDFVFASDLVRDAVMASGTVLPEMPTND
ncbi:hypothetical protein GTO89_11755 [Heliobacterium gestii]|uniref:MurNAc-LAA domain-containing protein n=1 Tax=Heliomicrobium gestii TaxID=2699 RepID=A0A845LAE3_HELGE|nr:divergent polysaccharide deacetylase family protein [Heliomicrobium gestii]MBM7867453.1 polysaccharide deacetylase 2 family uncharacterized protein YibQ/N-acetylmuramoyl-L-alanine amidase [Heliomicrobium gestii]MZP43717.1 hypothetical protein [Heliomicrobium gestii]